MNRGVKKNSAGFTLLELIIVIAILGILVSVVVPAFGYITGKQYDKLTREKLEAVRTAIAGPQNTYDERGLRVVRGYAGDLDALPKLYKCVWDSGDKRWNTVAEEVYHGGDLTTDPAHPYIGQPCGLWERETGEESPGTDWKGPYLGYPKALYANKDQEGISPLRKTEGILSDAWGRALFFIKEQDADGVCLLIISAGPDGEAALPPENLPAGPLGRNAYRNATDPENKNKDNIVLEITPEEWLTPNQGIQKERTRQILEQVRTALLGPADAYDPLGRRIVGGYIGDMGQWPTLWEWNAEEEKWAVSVSDEGQPREGQPRGLWVWTGSDEGYSDHEQGGGRDTGFCWRGPYLSKPWEEGENEVLRDAWDRALKFELGTKTLTITSAGPDKDYGTADDNQKIEIALDQWLVREMQVRGSVRNETPRVYVEDPPDSGQWVPVPDTEQPDDAELQLRLYHRPGEEPLEVSVTASAGETVHFALSAPVSGISAGLRRLEVNMAAGGLAGPNNLSLFIGAWGTQSPAEGKLTILVNNPVTTGP